MIKLAVRQVEGTKAYAARLKAESGDMRAVMSAIQDSVLAAGLDIAKHDEYGEPLAVSQARRCTCHIMKFICISTHTNEREISTPSHMRVRRMKTLACMYEGHCTDTPQKDCG